MLVLCKVQKSLEKMEHKDVLAQEIRDENDQLKHQLRQIISVQGAPHLHLHYSNAYFQNSCMAFA